MIGEIDRPILSRFEQMMMLVRDHPPRDQALDRAVVPIELSAHRAIGRT